MGGTIIQCRTCKKYQHKQCIGNSYAIKPYECALCQLYTFDPFYEIKDALTKPSLVQSYSPHVLFYSHQLKTEVYQAKGDKQIQIRCLKLDNQGYLNTWPAFGRLEVNHKLIREFKTNKNPNAKKRKDEPMNITILLQEGKNQISLIKELDDFTYVLGIFMVEKKSPESIVFSFRKQNAITYNQGLDFIITKLQ